MSEVKRGCWVDLTQASSEEKKFVTDSFVGLGSYDKYEISSSLSDYVAIEWMKDNNINGWYSIYGTNKSVKRKPTGTEITLTQLKDHMKQLTSPQPQWSVGKEAPPAGTWCEFQYSGKWYKVFVIGVNEKGICVISNPPFADKPTFYTNFWSCFRELEIEPEEVLLKSIDFLLSESFHESTLNLEEKGRLSHRLLNLVKENQDVIEQVFKTPS